jgi:type IV secretory pathway VirB10-like protein
MKSFQATAVLPIDAEVVLKRFNNHTSQQDTDTEIGGHGDGANWNQLRKVLDAAVEDKAKVESKRLAALVHSLQVNNHLLHIENDGLQRALYTKKKHKKKSNKLDLQQTQESHSGAVFWSPRKLREARAREKVEQDNAEQEKLQKNKARELKASETLYKKKMAEEAKAERQRAKEEREKAKKARREELAAARALKQQERDAATTQKSRDTLNKGRRKASQNAAPKNQSGVVLWVVEDELTLHLSRRLLHQNRHEHDQ